MDKYGGIEIPVLVDQPVFPLVQAPGDILLGFLGDYLKTCMNKYCGEIWESVQPGKPIVKTIFVDDPLEGFSDADLPALFLYRPPRETREVIESFDQVAEDYRFQHGRTVVIWLFDPVPRRPQHWERSNIFDAVRKCVDRCINIGRDPDWIVPGDTDQFIQPANVVPNPAYDSKAAVWGSSLLNHAGATVIELANSAPGKFILKMETPAPVKNYDQLRFSFDVEERLQYDLSTTGEPHITLQAHYVSPDQGTGLGTFDLGEEIYD